MRPGTLQRAFAETLKHVRAEHGMTQDSLASAAGLDRTGISLLERGLRLPNLETLFSLAEAMNIEPALLVAETAARARRRTKRDR